MRLVTPTRKVHTLQGWLVAGGLSLVLLVSASSHGDVVSSPARRVLIVSIDGLRPDVLLRSDAPVLRRLLARGSFTFWARTTAVSVTLPSHTSMLTGCRPARHGIEWNHDLPLLSPVYPKCPTLFELAHRAGLSTAMVAGKSKFRALAKPGTLNWCFVPAAAVIGDNEVADSACAMMTRHHPEVVFVHLPAVDTAGHTHGWGSSEQLAAVAVADHCVGRLLDAFGGEKALEAGWVMVTADHGGAGTDHGPDDPRSRTIPWILVGPGVRRGFDLATLADVNVEIEDTFATACRLLRIPTSGSIDGHLVTAALNERAAGLVVDTTAAISWH